MCKRTDYKRTCRAAEGARWLRALAATTEDPGLILSNHTWQLTTISILKDPTPSSGLACNTDTHADKHPYLNFKNAYNYSKKETSSFARSVSS